MVSEPDQDFGAVPVRRGGGRGEESRNIAQNRAICGAGRNSAGKKKRQALRLPVFMRQHKANRKYYDLQSLLPCF